MTTLEAESYLYSLPRFAGGAGTAYKPGLERIALLLEGMGRPQDAFDSILVAGTNGKGSTASMIAAIGTSAGHRVGLHTSPHLFQVGERMRIDGRPVPEDRLWNAVACYHDLAEQVKPSFFEFTVALSLLYFAEESVDVAVVEVGMGGRLDATSVLQPVLCVITDVGLDHTEFLGSSVEAIAREKAGIVKQGVPVVTSARREAQRVIRDAAFALGAAFYDAAADVSYVEPLLELEGIQLTAETPLRRYEDLFIGLAGEHQLRNARLALRAAELVYDDVRQRGDAVFDGLRRVRGLSGLRGRLDVVRKNPLVVADVAHNADGLDAVTCHLRNVGAVGGRLHVLFGVMRDKDVGAMVRTLKAVGAVVRPVAIESDRALSVEELDSQLRVDSVELGRPCTVREGVRDFLGTADPSDALLVTGSHFVVAALEELLPSF